MNYENIEIWYTSGHHALVTNCVRSKIKGDIYYIFDFNGFVHKFPICNINRIKEPNWNIDNENEGED
jgi:hypothetical protein